MSSACASGKQNTMLNHTLAVVVFMCAENKKEAAKEEGKELEVSSFKF